MITIYNLFPSHLNLNGDAANADVLAKRLSWQGVSNRIVAIETAEDMQLATNHISSGGGECFLVVGHGSQAALKDLEKFQAECRAIFEAAQAQGVPSIVVASGLELVGHAPSSLTERRSEFIFTETTVEGWPQKAFGYLNSTYDCESVRVRGTAILTTLHGPFLAKNPEWLDAILPRLGVEPVTGPSAAKAREYAEKIWEQNSK